MPHEIQWFLFVSAAFLAIAPLAWRLRSRPVLACAIAAGIGVGVLGAGLSWDSHLAAETHAQLRRLAEIPRVDRPGGYVTSDQCGSCHPAEYATWHGSFHRTMTTLAGPDTLKAALVPATLELNGEVYRLERKGDEYWAEVPDPGGEPAVGGASPGAKATPRALRRLSLITGSHHMQVYWMAGDRGNLQHLFPFSWLIPEQRWVPTKDTFLRDPALGHPFQHWNLNCIQCHATAGQPRPDRGFQEFDTRVGELGIACEACHGPADQHVARLHNPARRFLSRGAQGLALSILNPAKAGKQASAQICGQCHGIRWIPAGENVNLNGFSYRPGDDLDRSTPIVRPSRLDLQPFLVEPLRRKPAFLDEHYWPDGEVRVSGREFNGLVDSPCYERGQMTCLSCHSMHHYLDTDDQLSNRDASNTACLKCHSQFNSSLETHTHHEAGSSGSLCYNCHMPHTTYGLLKAIRSHRVTSPDAKVSLKTGRPNACNLCHLDQTLGWTAALLKEWYGQPVPELGREQGQFAAAVLASLRGDAGQRALAAWHMGWEPARKAADSQWMAPYLVHLLDDPYSAVRIVAQRSLRTLPGFQEIGSDLTNSAAERTNAQNRARQLLRAHPSAPSSKAEANALLLSPEGTLDQLEFQKLAAQRDDRSMDLQE